MKAVANTFDFIINTLPSNKGFGKYVKTAAPGGVMVQVGVPPTEEGNCNFNIFDIVGKADAFLIDKSRTNGLSLKIKRREDGDIRFFAFLSA